MAEDVLPADTGRFRDLVHQAALRVLVSVQGKQVSLGIILKSVINIPVEMDRLVRDQHRVPVQVHQADPYAVPFTDSQPPGNGQRPVHPGGHDHPAVFLHIQPYIVFPGILKMLLQFEGGRIPVSRDDPEGGKTRFRNLECNDSGIIPYNIVLSARVHQPWISLLQLRKARFPQHFPEACRGVEGSGRLLREIQKLFQAIHLFSLLFP